MTSRHYILQHIRPLQLLCIGIFLSLGATCHGAYWADDCTPAATGAGTELDPFCSIEWALANAASTSESLVYVHDGTYNEAVVMRDGVELRNVDGVQPQLILSGADQPVLFDGISDAVINGFIIDGSATTTSPNNSVVKVVGPGTELAIRNCDIIGNQIPESSKINAAIKLEGQLSIEVTGNTISNTSRAGIRFDIQSSTIQITNNTISNAAYAGISTNSTPLQNSTITILGNTIINNDRAGIYLTGDDSNNQVTIGGPGSDGNIIFQNGNWSVSGSGVRLKSIKRAEITNNNICSNGRGGILLEEVNTFNEHISGNIIRDNFATGINIGGNSNLTIGPNDIFGNGFSGISFNTEGNSYISSPASSGSVLIYRNAIHANTKAGISIVDHVTGSVKIQKNNIYQNEKAGIAVLNNCTVTITENDIKSHSGAAGIFTGTWEGTNNPPDSLQFNRVNGPALLTISKNKIHHNLTGMRLDHASGTISNNLIHHNARAGIRFSGNDVAPYVPFDSQGQAWGITSITNNTVVDNGTRTAELWAGAGIIYDDITDLTQPDPAYPPDTGFFLDRAFFDTPYLKHDITGQQNSRIIQNNIAAYNARVGIRDALCKIYYGPGPTDYNLPPNRDYNLYYYNMNMNNPTNPLTQLGGCAKWMGSAWVGNSYEQFANPLFMDRANQDYRLQSNSPGKNGGTGGAEMGAYGGSQPLNW